jgi:hypothetical protein
MPEAIPQINVGAMKRADFVRFLNTSTVGQHRKARGRKDCVTTVSTVSHWVDAGMPTNTNGTINLREACAWLAIQRKESRQQNIAVEQKEDRQVGNLKNELTKSQITAQNALAEQRTVRTQLDQFKRRLQEGELMEAKAVEQHEMDLAYWLGDVLSNFRRFAPRLFSLTSSYEKFIAELEKIGAELRTAAAAEYRTDPEPVTGTPDGNPAAQAS